MSDFLKCCIALITLAQISSCSNQLITSAQMSSIASAITLKECHA